MAGGKQDRKHKDKAMAAYMKEKGIKRTTAQCPMCHHTVSLGSLPAHVGRTGCHPRRPQYGRVRKAA